MASSVHHAPSFTPAQAADLAAGHLGVVAQPSRLPSERDQNFRLDVDGAPRYVLKIANPSESPAGLSAQHRLLHWLESHAPDLGVPRLVPATDGSEIVPVPDTKGVTHLVRVFSYLPGSILADHPPPRSPALLDSLGAFLGAFSVGLEGFEDPDAPRDFDWDLLHGVRTVRKRLDLIAEPERREVVSRLTDHFESAVHPRLVGFRRSVIHNDANDRNVLVQDDTVTGIIDFGDMVHSATAAEAAVGATYALLDDPDPLVTAGHVVRGFDRVFPLLPDEKSVLFDLMRMRLCLSVSICAEQKQLQPGNPYLTVSERPAWAALERLASIDPDQAANVLFAGSGAR